MLSFCLSLSQIHRFADNLHNAWVSVVSFYGLFGDAGIVNEGIELANMQSDGISYNKWNACHLHRTHPRPHNLAVTALRRCV